MAQLIHLQLKCPRGRGLVSLWHYLRSIRVMHRAHLNCTMLYFNMQKGDHGWAWWPTRAMLCSTMLLSWNERMGLESGELVDLQPTAYIWSRSSTIR
jgi:hypothetical protein